MPLALADLVRNGTMSPEMAATLAAAVDERRSFIVAAIPRLAGKTTTMLAMLAGRPQGTAVHPLSAPAGRLSGIPDRDDRGYLLIAEIARVPFDEYLWGAPVREAFRQAAERDFGIAAALHAGDAEEAFDIVTRQNGVPDEHAARIGLLIYIRTLGASWQQPDRRVVAGVYEVDGVQGGAPATRLLHHWDEASDRFVVDGPSSIASTALERRLAEFARLTA